MLYKTCTTPFFLKIIGTAGGLMGIAGDSNFPLDRFFINDDFLKKSNHFRVIKMGKFLVF